MGSTRATVLALALAPVLLVTGCTAVESSGGPPGSEDAIAVAATGKPARERKWRGAAALRYERSYRICSVFTVREIAEEFGVARKPRAAAMAHATELYEPQYRRAAFQGCLDAFEKRPPGIA
jgi:hypothetical protein